MMPTEEDPTYKLVSWQIGSATGDNGAVFPMVRTYVVGLDKSYLNEKQVIDLALPDDEAVKMLRDSLNDYLKSVQASRN